MTKFGYFITLWNPCQPVQCWDRKNSNWYGSKTSANAYTSVASANRAAGQVKSYMSYTSAQNVMVDYCSYEDVS